MRTPIQLFVKIDQAFVDLSKVTALEAAGKTATRIHLTATDLLVQLPLHQVVGCIRTAFHEIENKVGTSHISSHKEQ